MRYNQSMPTPISFAPAPSETLGQRIAHLRARRGWTQERLAERIAASRVAVSQFEAGLALPSERTIVLLAGLFRMEPTELVAGTSYPAGKAERLPAVTCRHTEVELQLALLRRDIEWASRVGAAGELPGRWEPVLAGLEQAADDPEEQALLRSARHELALALRPLP
jgi:transcriptional regulator with XRE-family HTH domain